MQLYAQNRKGRWVGKVFLIIVVGSVLYVGRNRIESHFSEIILLTILVVLLALCWAAYLVQLETAKVNEQFLMRLDELRENFNGKMSALEKLIKKQEDSISFALPAGNGWDIIHVYPAEKRFERSFGYADSPNFHEIIEYDLRWSTYANPLLSMLTQPVPKVVFARLVDKWTEEQSGTTLYQVINGTFLGNAEEAVPGALLRWHELYSPEIYVIFSAHGINKAFFRKKRRSIQEALKQLRARAEALGAVQVEKYGVIQYEAKPDADEVQKLAIERDIAIMVSETSLSEYGVTPREVFNQDYVYVLSKLADGQPEDAVLGDEDDVS